MERTFATDHEIGQTAGKSAINVTHASRLICAEYASIESLEDGGSTTRRQVCIPLRDGLRQHKPSGLNDSIKTINLTDLNYQIILFNIKLKQQVVQAMISEPRSERGRSDVSHVFCI